MPCDIEIFSDSFAELRKDMLLFAEDEIYEPSFYEKKWQLYGQTIMVSIRVNVTIESKEYANSIWIKYWNYFKEIFDHYTEYLFSVKKKIYLIILYLYPFLNLYVYRTVQLYRNLWIFIARDWVSNVRLETKTWKNDVWFKMNVIECIEEMSVVCILRAD